MNWKTVVPLVVALGLGTVAAVVGRNMVAKGRQAAAPTPGVSKVVVANEDLLPGATIRETDVGLREMPTAGIPADAAFTAAADVVGRVVTTQVKKGQAVLATLLAPKGALGGLQAMVLPGMRAVTLEVNEFSGVGGLLTPGSHVDVVQTINNGTGEAALLTRTIVENLKVLAVGRRTASVTTAAGTEAETSIPKSVTLLATAEQVEAIDLATHFGTPRLVLRNGEDGRMTAGKGLTVSELRGGPGGKSSGIMDALLGMMNNPPTSRPAETAKVEPVIEPVVTERPSFREVEVIRGGTSTSVRVTVKGERSDVVGGGDQLDRVVPSDR